MKVKFCNNNGANIHSKRVQIFDTEKDFGLTEEERLEMSDDYKYDMVKEWAMQDFEYWFEDIKD